MGRGESRIDALLAVEAALIPLSLIERKQVLLKNLSLTEVC